ncbi:MAG: polysaccharide deacetylase family protein [Spirochaetaceae bacterium]|jgi:peptidoglycan/xylan/chitin deacetylase (PgdA/CDA1 family)|nr:polysaccharide deacetylase family protein [Spirochaetaceae bacterium]
MKKTRIPLIWVLGGLILLTLAVNSCATIPAEDAKDSEVVMDDIVPAEAAQDVSETEAGILLGFDDNYYAGWEAAFSLFDRYGAKVTFFVQGNPAFCLNALEKGHDIGYHTENHVDLRNVDRATWTYETLDSARALRESGVPLAAFAYPFGFSDPWMNEELLQHYAIIRGFGVTPRFYTKEEIASGVITSKSIDNTVIPDDAAFYEMIGELLQTVKAAGNLIVPLTTHNIDDGAQWGIRRDRLEFLLRTASEMGLRFYTYREVALGR